MEYPPSRFLIVLAWMQGSISTAEAIEMLRLRDEMEGK